MKTAISIPDDVFSKAERYAKNNGISRSQLFATAVKSFIDNNELNSVTDKLNQVYSHHSDALDAGVASMQASSISRDEW